MTIKAICTDAELHAALVQLEVIFQAAEGSPEADERDVLVATIEAYENSHYAIGAGTPPYNRSAASKSSSTFAPFGS